tara:strand:+ start:523 stop:957 length:435 start_codon:yes stop_codon:yes gene_type:complete
VSLKELNTVSGVFDILNYRSVTIKLDDVISDLEIESQIINKLLECRNISGRFFKVIFYHEKLSSSDCKEFIKRNKDILFDLNTDITKTKDYRTWLLIGSDNSIEWRYRWSGGVISGLDQYINITNNINRRIKSFVGVNYGRKDN